MRIPIESSTILEVSYDEAIQVLEVTFRRGASYKYFDVPGNVIAELLEAESKGSFFARNIAKTYKYEKIMP